MAKYVTNVVYMIFLGIYCAQITSSTSLNNSPDALALLAFRAAIVDPLGALNSWNQTQHYCTWKGIGCGFKHPDRVIEINLMSQGLVGSLSAHVGNLSFLKKINLKNNTFRGQIPQEMGRLRRLQFLDFSNNTFVGEIPRNISQCLNLVVLNLVDNKLTGNIPIELGFMPNLQRLKLRRNNIFGSIPPCLGNLTALIVLSLSECNLTGEIPESLVQIQSLAALELFKNTLTGRIPRGLFNISTLIVLSLSDNPLQGVIPDNIGLTLPNLQVLELGVNHLTGQLPISLSNATSLDTVDLSSNSLKGPMPKELGRLSNLYYFVLTNNLIQDDISFISSFTNCTKLIALGVSENILSGSLPNSLANLSSQLWSLEIAETQVHGNIPSGIGNIEGLTRLLLNDNNLEGPIPFGIGKLSNLVGLYLDGNRFTDEIPHSIGNLTLLNHLHLQQNNFSGSIPQSLGNCSSLLSLDIATNDLDGSIPAQIMSLSSISIYLDLSDNGFTGSIPFEVSYLTHISNIFLSNNRLSGVIPSTLSSCTSLERLYLEGNFLEGEIPPALSALTGLRDLDLSRNNLSGKIPNFLSRLNLENLNLSFNRLNGEVPILGAFGNKTTISIEGNRELCGGIRELKLPPCSSSKYSKKHWSPSHKILISTLVAGGFCITLCACVFRYIYRQIMSRKNKSSTWSFDGFQFLRLSYGDLLKATGGFSDGNLVGAGRFGSVYRGVLEDGETVVAVKVLNRFVKGASKTFIAECMALKGIKHRNLLKLLTVCESIDFQRNEFKALVYEFMSNGSLEDLLYRKKEQDKEPDVEFRSLTMLQRLKIAIDIAHALEYLHIGTDSAIIHGDLKPSNVLLDNDMTAYVGDFGLSKVVSSLLEAPESSNTIGIRGTIGYVPPEYGTSNLVSTKGDVYSYGILLLEMFTGKRPTDQVFDENLNLHNFVVRALPNHVTEIVDPLIFEGHEMNTKMKGCVASMLSIGVACSRKTPMYRMSMTDVVYRVCEIRELYG